MNMPLRKGDIVGVVPLGDRPMVPVKTPDRWFLLKVFAGQERKVMAAFARRGVSAWCPMERKSVLREQRRFGVVVRRIPVEIRRPLFDGVIFIPDWQARLGGVMVDGVEGYFRMDQCYPYLDAEGYQRVREIEQLKNMPVSRAKRMLLQGQSVRVKDGPFAGFFAEFDRLDSEGRLKVLLTLFGRLSFVTLDESQIEPA